MEVGRKMMLTNTGTLGRRPVIVRVLAFVSVICVAGMPSAVISAEADANGKAGSAARTILIHSHNDYAQKRPFWGAYEAGADSIEADVFFVDGELVVAHSRRNLKPENTLRRLYLEPLREVFKKNGGRVRANGKPLQLLVDLKNGKPAFDALVTLIEREGFRDCFDICKNPSAARLTITGDNTGIDFSATPAFVFFDVPSNRKLDAEQYKRVWLVSDCARIYTKWRSGEMKEDDKRKIREAAAKAHARGVLFRLWGFPDHPDAWRLSLELGLDYINTDRPAAVARIYKSGLTAAVRSERLFLASHVSDDFGHGLSGTVSGKSGWELAVEILEDAKVEFRHEKPKGGVGRSREFWAGWALAQYQWRIGLSFAEIEAFAPLHTILLMYSPYHEMDITQLFEALDGLRVPQRA